MAVDSVSSATTGPAGLSMQDFLKVLTTQLTHQDPLKPMDNQQFIAQLAQFTSLQQTQELNQKLDQLLSIQAANQSVGLIGRTVDVLTASGTSTGVVSALSFTSGEPRMTIRMNTGGTITDISMANLVAVR